jgi:hypothetical protein
MERTHQKENTSVSQTDKKNNIGAVTLSVWRSGGNSQKENTNVSQTDKKNNIGAVTFICLEKWREQPKGKYKRKSNR